MLAQICYDGTHYLGWQKTKLGPTIQQALENAFYAILKRPIKTDAVSRTDRGVHAKGQLVLFELYGWDKKALQQALNSHLPEDIRVLELFERDTFPSKIKKEYHYHLFLGPSHAPHQRFFTWHIYKNLKPYLIQEAIKPLLGAHDFTGFSNKNSEEKENPICQVEKIDFDGKTFQIIGDRFLYKMVRNLVGTLVYIGMEKFAPSIIEEILEKKDRKLGGITAPAHGLCLHQVHFSVK